MAKFVYAVLFLAVFQYFSTEVNGATDCSTFSTCTECVSLKNGCDWCTAAFKCTNKVGDTCPNDLVVSNAFKIKTELRSGPDNCPKFTGVGNETEILIPSGAKKSIKAKINVHGHFLLQKQFICKFTIDGKEIIANAHLLGDTFTCDPVLFKTDSPRSTVKFEILWEKTKALANPTNVHLVVYNWFNSTTFWHTKHFQHEIPPFLLHRRYFPVFSSAARLEISQYMKVNKSNLSFLWSIFF